MSRGRFITFEGGEGGGKTTQIRRLEARLTAAGRTVVRTREPGGSPGAEEIRPLLLTGDPGKWSASSEALLNYAARNDHIERVIAPALARGDWVLCDRFADSTRAYQGAAGGAPEGLIVALETWIVGDTRPDLTLVLDLPADVGLERSMARAANTETRYEAKGLAFHERLRAAFLDIAARESGRCAVIDASQSIDAVEAAVWDAVQARLA